MVAVVTSDEVENPACCGVYCAILKVCGMMCYISCPPIPSHITKKLAFHPPEKGMTYTLQLKDNAERKVSTVAEVADEDFEVVPKNIYGAPQNVFSFMKTVETFSVKTVHNNDLVCVRCRPTFAHEPDGCSLCQQVVLFCQPNSSDLGGFLQPVMANLVGFANIFEVDVYAFDYSGYGYSSGTACEKNVYADVRAVFQYIRDKKPDKKIVLMGYSIGTTAAIDLAAEDPEGLSGVVLVAPFTSGLRLVSSQPDRPNTCCVDSFLSYDKVVNIKKKVLICHGDKDEVIPVKHGKVLHERLRNQARISIISEANHQTILSGQFLETFSQISRFIREETDVSASKEPGSPASQQQSPTTQLKHSE